jgi:hypothetical protein
LWLTTRRLRNFVFISVIGVHLEGSWTPSFSESGLVGKGGVY